MSYVAYVTKLKNLHKHPNADRLQIGECFGNSVVVSLDYVDDQLGIYFPTDGQLSEEFATYNNLLRKKDENGKECGGYMDPKKRNVTAVRLRGEKSDGLFLPLSCVSYTGVDINSLKNGDNFTALNGHEICTKYIPQTNVRRGHVSGGNRTRKKVVPIAPLFVEHADTEQLAYNLGAFLPDDHIEITLKMHGTSQRTGYLPVLRGYKRSLIDKLLKREGTPVYDWGYVTGTRRVVLDSFDGGFYGSNEFREQHHKFFEGKLWKGETVYYEVVGFTDSGTPIMAQCDNKRMNDKEFVKRYGQTTTFSYGCSATGLNTLGDGSHDVLPISDIYVYRMTMTNEDGNVVEYTPEFMRYRCEQMGAKTVPVFANVKLPAAEYFDDEHPVGEYVKEMAEQYYDGADPVGKTHIREGVVVRIINRPKFSALKHKNFSFKVLEGISKVEAAEPDMEEAQEL